MILEGESFIPVERRKVWQALNDPDVLRACIPGCQSLEKLSDTEFTSSVRASIGPISSTFNATIMLTDIEPDRGYTINGEGRGGAAGFARGKAKVLLDDENGGTRLRYSADVNVGGKLAQVGSRLIQGTAKKLSEQFFGGFVKVLSADAPRPDVQAISTPTPPPAQPGRAAGNWLAWGVGVLILVVAVGWWIGR